MRVKYNVRESRFLTPCVDALAAGAADLEAGRSVVVPLPQAGDGMPTHLTATIGADERSFEADWTKDESLVAARVKAAATALRQMGHAGTFELTHHPGSGVVVVRRAGVLPMAPGRARTAGKPGAEVADEWRRKIAALNVNVQRGNRAVHKPLLCLLVLARAEDGGSREFRFKELEKPLAELLREFGRPTRSVHPEYPFWYLQSDGFWVVERRESFTLREAGNAPTVSELRRKDATAAVPEPLWDALCTKPLLRDELVAMLLAEFWPHTLHDAIRSAIGLPEAGVRTSPGRVRDKRFRETVLRNYARSCAACGFDGRLGRDDLMIEAAHVRWHSEGGPDLPENGVALCTMHHSSFDRGALGIASDLRLIVSQHLAGGDLVDTYLRRHSSRKLRLPLAGSPPPSEQYLAWHRRQVFREPALGR